MQQVITASEWTSEFSVLKDITQQDGAPLVFHLLNIISVWISKWSVIFEGWKKTYILR